ncbi:MAG: DUF4230 domain-containing protein [Chitinophagaceae bacterium]
MLKRIITYSVVAFIIIATLFLLRNKWFPSVAGIFKPKPVIIDDTPILIKQITDLAQMCTITVFDEVVADSVEIKAKSTLNILIPVITGINNVPVASRELVIIAKGKIIAGTDLKKLQPQQFFINKDSVSLTLPRAEILDAIINPSGIETFSEIGLWKDNEITVVKIKARNKMIARALQQQVIEKANARSIMLMENFLKSAGFKKITVKTV